MDMKVENGGAEGKAPAATTETGAALALEARRAILQAMVPHKLAAHDKGWHVRLSKEKRPGPGWNAPGPADRQELEDSASSLALTAWGFLISDRTLGIDVDISDNALADKVLDAAADILGERFDEMILIERAGTGKVKLVAQLAGDVVPIPPSPGYLPPGADPANGDKAQMIEFGTAAHPRYYAVEGINGYDDGTPQMYLPADDGPLPWTHGPGELPLVTMDEITRLIGRWCEIAEAAGWTRARHFSLPDHYGRQLYDLPDGALDEHAPGDRLRPRDLPFLDDTSDTVRLSVVTRDDGVVGVHDFKHACTHWPASAEPAPVGEVAVAKVVQLADRLKALGRLTAEIIEAREAEIAAEEAMTVADLDDWVADGWRALVPKDVDYEAMALDWMRENGFTVADDTEPPEAIVAAMAGEVELRAMSDHLALRYCFVAGAQNEGEAVFDIKTGKTTSVALLEKQYAQLEARVPAVTPKIDFTTRVTPAVRRWLKSRNRITISRYDFTPGRPELFLPGDEEDTVGVNVWREKRFTGEPMEPALCGRLFTEFCQLLCPEEPEEGQPVSEAAFLLNHVTGIVQQPQLRGQAVLMVSSVGRVGRGTLFEMVDLMVCPQFRHTLTTQDIVGEGAKWTEWQERCVVAHVDEMASLGSDKYKAMALLDDMIDNRVSRKQITEKGKSRRTVSVYWTLFAATMKLDAIVLEPRDQRWTILRNTDLPVMQSPRMKAVLTQMQEYANGPIREDFAHGLFLWLKAQPFDRELFLNGMMTEVKRSVLQVSTNHDIENTLRAVLADLVREGKFEVWVPNVVKTVEGRIGSRASPGLMTKVPVVVPQLLDQGFEGWKVPVDPKTGRKERPRVRVPDAPIERDQRPSGQIARHAAAPNYTAEERYRVIGERAA